jgi:hypothetical protein
MHAFSARRASDKTKPHVTLGNVPLYVRVQIEFHVYIFSSLNDFLLIWFVYTTLSVHVFDSVSFTSRVTY